MLRLSRRILRSAGVQMPGGQADGLSCALFARTLLVVPEACDVDNAILCVDEDDVVQEEAL